jgi:hypothetical protein
MDPIILTLVIAGGVIFLFVLAARLAWHVRSMAEYPDGRGAKRVDGYDSSGSAEAPARADETADGDR